jgi:NAD(P)H-dependent FMN reductase
MARMGVLKILVVAGSLNHHSSTRVVTQFCAKAWRESSCEVDEVDLAKEALPLFDPDSSYKGSIYLALKPRVEAADVIVLGSPDYHGTIASPLKNFLDHFWQEYAGKLFATIVGSYEKGLTVSDHLRTVARQCYAWSMPYAVSFSDREDVVAGEIKSEAFQKRLEMFVRDVRVYGEALAQQRHKDLAGTDPGFLARLRK